ncbi:uncharacterized protein LOC100184958 [Ciona intestinalis]
MDAIDKYTSNRHESRIGSGGYGVVRLCHHKTRGKVAVKCTLVDVKIRPSEEFFEKIEREADFLTKFDHKNIIKFLESVRWSGEKVNLGLVVEYMEHGNLQGLLESELRTNSTEDIEKRELKWGLRLRILHEVCEGLVYLHGYKKGCTHGDIKPENILLDEQLHAKIADFGTAEFILSTQASCHTTSNSNPQGQGLGHTLAYVAPEVLKNCLAVKKPSSDMFSFGSLAYEVATRQHPWEGAKVDPKMITQLIQQGAHPTPQDKFEDYLDENKDAFTVKEGEILEKLTKVLEKCWYENPKERITSKQALAAVKELIQLNGENEVDIACHVKEIIEEKKKSVPAPAKKAHQIPLKLFSSPYDTVTDENLPPRYQEDAPFVPPTPTTASSGPQRKLTDSQISELKNSLFMVGGHASNVIKQVFKFTPNLRRLKEYAKLRQKRCECIALQIGSKLCVFGGVMGAQALNTVECLDLNVTNSSWESLAPMHECRYQAAATVLKGKVYMFAGKNEKDETLNSIEVYDVLTNEWTMLEQKLTGRRYGHVVFSLHEEFIACFGGKNYNGEPLDTADLFHPGNKTVTPYDKPMPEKRSEMALVCLDEHVLLLGGIVSTGEGKLKVMKITNTVLSFNLKEQKWENHSSMEYQRCSFSAGVIDNTVYAIGGFGENTQRSSLCSIEKLDLSKNKVKWEVDMMIDYNLSGHTVVA